MIIYGILLLISGAKLPKERWIANFLGITMMNEYAWFPIVLAVLYLVFYLSFRFIKNRPACFAVIFVFIIALGIGFCYNGHFAWWYGDPNWWVKPQLASRALWWQAQKALWFSGEWWVNSAPATDLSRVLTPRKIILRDLSGTGLSRLSLFPSTLT